MGAARKGMGRRRGCCAALDVEPPKLRSQPPLI